MPAGTGPPPPIQNEGFDVHIGNAGRYILTTVNGRAMPVTVEEYTSSTLSTRCPRRCYALRRAFSGEL
jgi:hypothetical protein